MSRRVSRSLSVHSLSSDAILLHRDTILAQGRLGAAGAAATGVSGPGPFVIAGRYAVVKKADEDDGRGVGEAMKGPSSVTCTAKSVASIDHALGDRRTDRMPILLVRLPFAKARPEPPVAAPDPTGLLTPLE